MKMLRITKIFIALTLLLYTQVLAKDINFEATVDRNKVGLGQSLQLGLTFDGSENMPAPELSVIEGFQARYLGPSTRMSIINGQTSSSVTYVYTLLPTKVGTFKLGPFKFEHNDNTYNSNILEVEVSEASVTPSENQSSSQEAPQPKDLNERIFLTFQLKKDKIYLNEIVPVTIKLYVNKLGVRDIQFPQFNHDGFSVGEFGMPKQYPEVVNGVNFEVIEFSTTIFGLKPQEFRLGPATIQCNLIVRKQANRQSSSFDDFFNSDVFDNIFNGYQAYPMNLKSADIPVTVLPLPAQNKPEGFLGALGVFDFQVSLSPLEVKVGDPITLKVTVTGNGNFNTVTLPNLSLGDNFKTYDPQVKQEKDGKTFEEVLIPLNASVKEIPAMSFNFFDTQTGLYETITRGPFSIRVIKPEKEEELKIIETKQPAHTLIKEEKLGRDIIYLKDNPGQLSKRQVYLYKNKLFLGFLIIFLLFYLLLVVMDARKRKLATDVRYARQLLAPRKAKSGILRAKMFLEKGSVREFYDTLFDVLQEYLGNKFHLSSKGITISIIDEQLKQTSIPEEILTKLRNIFSECDMVRYAASQLRKENMQNSLKSLEEVIDYLQRHRI